jgi:hypothetical protein
MPSALNTSSNTEPKRSSRSCTRYCTATGRDSLASERLRAICAHQAMFAEPSVMPPMRTRRVLSSMKNRTCSVFSLIVSTVNRSQAMIEDAWDRMNSRQVSRFGPGRGLAARIRRIEVAEISMPTFASSPWILL